MQAMRIFVFTRSLQFQRSRSMRHLMPIVTPRLILRPPTLGDLDSIQTAKEEAWPGGMRRDVVSAPPLEALLKSPAPP